MFPCSWRDERHEAIYMKYSAKQRKIMDNLFLWKSASATSLCKSFYSPRKLRLFFSLIDSWRAHQKTPALALDLPPNKGRASVTQVNAMRFTTMSVVTFRTSNPYSTIRHLIYALFNTWNAVTYHEQIILNVIYPWYLDYYVCMGCSRETTLEEKKNKNPSQAVSLTVGLNHFISTRTTLNKYTQRKSNYFEAEWFTREGIVERRFSWRIWHSQWQ